MKKILLLTFFIFNSFLFSSELLTYQKRNNSYSYCIDDYYIYNNRIYFKKSKSSYYDNELLTRIKSYDLKSGYIYNNSVCEKSSLITSNFKTTTTKSLTHNNLSILGLSNEQLNFMFALSGILTSFIFLFGIFRWI